MPHSYYSNEITAAAAQAAVEHALFSVSQVGLDEPTYMARLRACASEHVRAHACATPEFGGSRAIRATRIEIGEILARKPWRPV